MKSFDVLTSDQELKVCKATYGPEIDKSQHAEIRWPYNRSLYVHVTERPTMNVEHNTTQQKSI